MAILTLEDLTGIAKAFVFPKAYPGLSDILEENQVYQISGELMVKDDDAPSIAINDMKLIKEAMVKRAIVSIPNHQAAKDFMSIIGKFKGYDPVYVETPGMRILLNRAHWVSIESLELAQSANALPSTFTIQYKTW